MECSLEHDLSKVLLIDCIATRSGKLSQDAQTVGGPPCAVIPNVMMNEEEEGKRGRVDKGRVGAF